MTTGVVPQFHRKWHGNHDEWPFDDSEITLALQKSTCPKTL
jgi:hypothetical protein